MRIGAGIDTGGTYTDAVLYDFDSKRILATAKSLTTKEDLALGIGRVLDALPAQLLRQTELVGLSTTLATNACVENKGGRAKLILINAYEKVVREQGHKYGLPPAEEICFVQGEAETGRIPEQEWQRLLRQSKEWLAEAEALAVVESNAAENNAQVERGLRELIATQDDIPVICGHELFRDLNVLRRGASTLLNARLLPLVAEFLASIRQALRQRDIQAPVVIVRSDGSLMSESFTGERPVETLLCGPAASAGGGMALTEEQDCIVVDIGGTTTDISLIKGGMPVLVKDGVNVGKWRTFVKGIFIETFGLGGDSAVRYDRFGKLYLDTRRVIPLCQAASQWPQIRQKLAALAATGKGHSRPLHEFFVLMHDIGGQSKYSEREQSFCAALRSGPLILSEAAAVMGEDVYTLDMRRLEKEGVVLRCGLTPTDVMHVKGDFDRYDTEASRLALSFVACSVKCQPEQLAEQIYELVKETLYRRLLRLAAEDKYPALRQGVGAGLQAMIDESWRRARNLVADGEEPAGPRAMLAEDFRLTVPLIGIGAPVHVFLPDVARALGTTCLIPEHAEVANALGAVVGNIYATVEIKVEVYKPGEEFDRYIVYGQEENSVVDGLDTAKGLAAAEASAAARAEAYRRGATGEVSVSVELVSNSAAVMDEIEIFIEMKAVARAVGRIGLAGDDRQSAEDGQ